MAILFFETLEPSGRLNGSCEIMRTMRNDGPLILVEDDTDDQELMTLAFKDLGCLNTIRIFKNGHEALDYLYKTAERPFLILSDINMPLMDGISLKKSIDACDILKKKCIPFVFISTSPQPFISQICDLNVQGFFEKGNSMNQLNQTLQTILNYWNFTKHIR